MTGEFQFPPAPEIGGDSFEVAEWLEKVRVHFDEMCFPDQVDAVEEMLRAFWEANPETTPARIQADRERRLQTNRERQAQRQAEIQSMKDPGWIFEEEEE